MTSMAQSRCSWSAAPGVSVDGVADGRERVPQLVGEHREELVLLAGRCPQLLVELLAVPMADAARFASAVATRTSISLNRCGVR